MFSNLLGKGDSQLPSIIKDPFSKKSIKAVNIFWRPYDQWSGSIQFRDGDTEGCQNLKSSPDFNNITAQLKAIIESIK